MKKNPLIFLALWMSLSLTACGPGTSQEQQAGDETPAETTTEPQSRSGSNSKLALDWNGTYKGVLPCADCEGIETAITLYSTGKFKRTMKYLGKDDRFFKDEGDIQWNEAGSIITISTEDGTSQMYQVGENILFHLDQDGNRISGDLAAKYRLQKNRMDPRIENTRWVLKEIKGQEVVIGEGNKEAFLMLNSEEGIYSGNNSCNVFSGSYELKEGDRITFSQGINTLMACPDMTTADTLNEVFGMVDNYAVRNGMLSLNRARMAPLARFEKVEE